MAVIYEPTGKAREFGDLACNLYDGCSHGCVYCYAPGVLRKSKDSFSNPKPRKDILKRLEKDAKKYRGSKIPIFLCFTCDPYQPGDVFHTTTRKALEILTENECAINILTKGGPRATYDFDMLRSNSLNWFGTTLTYADRYSSNKYEPKAAYPLARIQAMERAKSEGINTWISFEPVLDPHAILGMIRRTLDFCDIYKIGKLNHHKSFCPSGEELKAFLLEAISLLERHGKRYYVKEDTRPFLEGY